MKKTTILFVTVFIHLSILAQKSEISILKENWRNYLLTEEINQEMVPYFFNIRSNGTWSDLDYNNRQRSKWPLRAHLWRTFEMAKVYQQESNINYKNEALKKNILLAYDWWVDNDIINPNWWNPQIGVPQAIGIIMLLMENEIEHDQWKKGITIMDRVKFGKQTGQNLVWVSSNIALRSILKSDSTLLPEATENIRREMQISDEQEGLQPDYSFHQHGRQLQLGNYGLHFLEDQVKWMYILKGSTYDYTTEQIKIIRNYFSQGQRWVVWKGVYDINSCGRQLFPNEQTKKYKRVHKSAKEMRSIDAEHTNLYQAIIDGNNITGTKHFPYSDLTIQQSDTHMTSIRMCSNRTLGSESGNGENLSGYYLADGAMYTLKTGKEYLNIFPYWNWRNIPGVTSVQDTVKLAELGWKSYNLKSDFVGGLTYDDSAITSMQYFRDQVFANKTYFLFPEFTVCLGSSIQGTKNQHLQTTIEQCFSTTATYINNEEIFINKNSKVPVASKNFWHQGSGYIINEGNGVLCSTENKPGYWNSIVNSSTKKEKPRRIFTLAIDHGKGVKNEKYAYAIFPNLAKKDFENTFKNQPYDIISNNETIQAVQYNELTSIVFHKASSILINNDIIIASNVPGLLLCKKRQNHLIISVSDPTQLLNSCTISIQQLKQTNTSTITKKIIFPKGIEKGKTTTILLNLN